MLLEILTHFLTILLVSSSPCKKVFSIKNINFNEHDTLKWIEYWWVSSAPVRNLEGIFSKD